MSRPVKPKGPCLCGCGEIAETRGYSHRCYARWAKYGFPDGGPPQPGQGRPPEFDPYDLQWLAGEPERRARRARWFAADLIRCVAASDAEGVRLLLHRVSDWHALAVVLAECASPERAEVVCRSLSATLAAAALAAVPADDAASERSHLVTVALSAVEGGTREAAA